MAKTGQKSLLSNSDMMLALGVVVILMVMVFPMPTAIMDFLIALSFAIALLILMVSMYIRRPLEFSVFPGLLLIVTLFRLSLNVASTRLILGQAYAGKIISAFGDVVIKGNYVVGLIIFLILVVINFVVITKGAGRVAEVAARFTLDSMPGKQMSIDADLNAGLIDETEARQRRVEITREADFYGSMDGASKFVRGDAVAGLVITALNIVGGLIIGVLQHRMALGDAARTYTQLTVGDGLVSQIPALVISTAAGLVVTRTAADTNLGQELTGQIFKSPRAIMLASAVLAILGITPGLPTLPFFALAATTGAIGYMVRKAQEKPKPEPETKPAPEAKDEVEDYLRVDPLELEIGYALIPLVDAQQGGDLLVRISQLRKQCASEIGIVVPPIRIRDNIQLKPNEYIIKIRGGDAARGELMLGRFLALNPGSVEGDLEGVKIKEPAFGLSAVWISEPQREKAETLGFTVVEAVSVLTTHLLEVVKSSAYRLVGRQEVQNLLDRIKKNHPALIEELIPNLLSLGGVEKVLQNLLRERISVRNLGTILETLADYSALTKDPDILTEYVRQSLSEALVQPYVTESGAVRAVLLDTGLEQIFNQSIQESRKTGGGHGAVSLSIPPKVLETLVSALASEMEKCVKRGLQPIIVVSPGIRIHFRKLVEGIFPNLVVLSYAEIPTKYQIESIGTVRLSHAGETISRAIPQGSLAGR